MPLTQQERLELKRFGASVRRERTARGLTQEQLAERVNLNIRTVQKIEAGQVNILLTTVVRFQRALRCPWTRLISESR